MALTKSEQAQLVAACGTAFSPSAPIDRLRLFAGRLAEIRKISDAVSTRGRHSILYGERGVGKTSLTRILRDLFREIAPGMQIVMVNCAKSDGFRNVWGKAFREIPVVTEMPVTQNGGPADNVPAEYTLEDYARAYEHFGPGEVRRLLQKVSQDDFELVIVFDEFNELPDEQRALFADTIKDLSDNSARTTLVLVGVARDVVELISEHASIDRCLIQILMPPMDMDELRDILDKAMSILGMRIEDDAKGMIVFLSQGYPHYTHLIGRESAIRAIYAGRKTITLADVHEGIEEAIDQSQQTVRDDYYRAAQGQRKGTLFPHVLLACALAAADELGYFTSSDVRTPLRGITGKDYEIPNFSQHLDAFSSDASRGPVLEKRGSRYRFRFRFRNALLRPFIIMKGIRDKVITGDLLEKLIAAKKRSLFSI
jgi:Cdc6-like AAA superfamily ATPase